MEGNDDISILHINSVSDKDEGEIVCTAQYVCDNCKDKTSSIGKCSCLDSSSSCSADLIILPQQEKSNSIDDGDDDDVKNIEESIPKIISGPKDLNVFRGENIVLRASYTGQPEPIVKWLKGVSLFVC